MKELEILVSGFTGTGKSTIIQIIKDALKQNGIDVNIIDPDRVDDETFDLRLEELKKSFLMCHIKEVQALRKI